VSVTSETATSPAELKYTRQTVLSTRLWSSEKLFSVRTTRDAAFNFVPGQFARLGLAILPGEPESPTEWRAYSMVSHPAEDALEFFSVIVPDGKFSPALARLQAGDPLWIDKTSFGFLTLERFTDGEDLWLVATGTGLSAYLSMLQDPQTWLRFKHVILVHGVQYAHELAYRDEILRIDAKHTPNQLRYIPITSQEHTSPELSPALKSLTAPARITTLLDDGELEHRVGIALDPSRSRVMLCGNPAMVTDMRARLSSKGFAPGRRGVAGNMAVENYW
jgi:ferredoxin--NADP+ reductase